MGQAAAPFDFQPGETGGGGRGLGALAVSIFADRGYLRAEMAEDAAAAGLRVAQTADFERLLGGDGAPAGDLVLVDCPVVEGAQLAALSQLDIHAAKGLAHLVVSTSIGSLDDVFGCLDQSDAQILVSPSRAERVIALGRVIARLGNRVRELSEDDRLSLLRLTDQVTQIAQKLEALSSGSNVVSPDASAFRFDGHGDDTRMEEPGDRLVRAARPALPDPRLVRRVIRQRQLRGRFFGGDLFADPAWDMLLDLTAARAEHVRVSVTSLCIASGVPPTTALRWIGQMTDAGLLQRVDDETDRRRAFITLSDKAADAMARYFAELAATASALV
ncbi:winged helix DNA-binding protein [Novosphingobium sp. KCTC 2891]|uniref:winged helix DNA-binding protein n=1 Tax=Novosphingobium sp. KCTC 2891 TaxID=2989730 RepID=UPI0022236D78|nr:winged helix DNA-binding protein [Novosphingobium sp. KCTC 2891]MCW1382513.1 winged helix DNA-binding protein [Novosphingobium sp. KCTC 2891]